MSFVNRLFKKSKKKPEQSGKSVADDELTLKSIDSSPNSKTCLSTSEATQTQSSVWRGRKLSALADSDEESQHSGKWSASSSTSDMENYPVDKITTTRQRLLRRQLYKLRKQEKKLKRNQKKSLALDREIDQVTTLITTVKLQNNALNEDILNKKCDLNFLQSEIPDDIEAEAKSREPVFYKKYANMKSAEDGKTLLTNIRQKMKALQYMELVAYDKYIDFQHHLKSSAVLAQSSIMSKNRRRHFGHLTDTMEYKRKSRAEKRSCAKMMSCESGSDALDMLTTVTIESPTRELESSPEIVLAAPPLTVPPVPPNMYTVLSVAAECRPPLETQL